ncbi:OmpA family protein [Leptolyngbya sp. FACHB-261]|uniref:OmpA family protein n=1 Tax=Leptolyngbya sp. FACHB-261 TaxID=2692806 RepID=UPI0016886478|nr:OmpA family protein [Leptolyngbya sp. FACHB-261]MBD2099846.1 OmpA family protein [Leptolyngbya sp. FACHB-261]
MKQPIPITRPKSTPAPRGVHPIAALLVGVFRLSLLALGAGLAWSIGMGVALFQPAATTPANPPWSEQIRRLLPLGAAEPVAKTNAITGNLASDALFETNSVVQLRANAAEVLAPVIASLKAQPGATVLITSHTDEGGSPDAALALSYRQALAVQTALSQNLGADAYEWVPIGAGTEQPEGTSGSQDLARRVEIAILP